VSTGITVISSGKARCFLSRATAFASRNHSLS
jgi:hypothetical protein